jgi:hypothetical protein
MIMNNYNRKYKPKGYYWLPNQERVSSRSIIAFLWRINPEEWFCCFVGLPKNNNFRHFRHFSSL